MKIKDIKKFLERYDDEIDIYAFFGEMGCKVLKNKEDLAARKELFKFAEDTLR